MRQNTQLPRVPASQALGDERDDQRVQAHTLLPGLGGKLGVKAFRNPLNPFEVWAPLTVRQRLLEGVVGKPVLSMVAT